MCTQYLCCIIYLAVYLKDVSCNTIFLEMDNPTKYQVSFLKKYGYLPETSGEMDFAYTSQSMSEAVRHMQTFAGLPPTGELDLHTKELFQKKRCGVKDINQSTKSRSRRYVLQQGWNKKYITYRVLNGSSSLPQPRVEALMEDALAKWAPHAGLHFSRAPENEHADIQISFVREDHGDGFPFDGPGHVVAHAFPPPHGEMHFDDDEAWGEGAQDSDDVTDLFAVAIHEVGHALGLSHSPVKASVMYPYYQVPVQVLHIDDIMGIQDLYGKNELPEETVAYVIERASSSLPAPRPTIADDDDNEIPDLCYTNYDTMQTIQGRIFVFEEEFMWVIKDKVIEKGFPRRFHEVFIGLPTRINAIRAIYEKLNGNIVIFSGRKYWEFNPKFQLRKVGRLSDYSLPRRVGELTTAFVSNFNNKTYLVQYERFWRYDEATGAMDPGYPKEMSAWRDVPYPVDAALIWKGDTYMFRGPRFWRFDNEEVRAHRYYPLPTAPIWFPCAPSPDSDQYLTNDER